MDLPLSIKYSPLYRLSILYLMIPVMIFIAGWMHWYIALPLLGSYCYLEFLEYRRSRRCFCWRLFIKENCSVKRLITGIILLLWLILSGWGGVVWQHPDFIVRNSMLGALSLESWPVKYSEDTYFCYYFASYLPAALCGKIFGLAAAKIILVLWFSLGLYLVWLWMCEYCGSFSFMVLSSLILFGSFTSVRLLFKVFLPGLEYGLPFISIAQQITLTAHQAVPVMLILCLIVAGRVKVEQSVFLLAATALSSPLCAFFMLFIFLAFLVQEKIGKSGEWKQLFSYGNIISGATGILIVLFMSCNISVSRKSYFLFPYSDVVFWIYIMTSFVFYCLFCMEEYKKDIMFYTVLAVSLALPCFYIGNDINDFACKSSIIGTFVILMFVLRSVVRRPRKKIWYMACLIFGGALVSCPLGIYASCTPLFLSIQDRLYGFLPDSSVKLLLRGKTCFPHMRYQDGWGNTMYHPEHYWYPNFTGKKNGLLGLFYKLDKS